jgi:hypothetical protein
MIISTLISDYRKLSGLKTPNHGAEGGLNPAGVIAVHDAFAKNQECRSSQMRQQKTPTVAGGGFCFGLTDRPKGYTVVS